MLMRWTDRLFQQVFGRHERLFLFVYQVYCLCATRGVCVAFVLDVIRTIKLPFRVSMYTLRSFRGPIGHFVSVKLNRSPV